MCKVDIVDRIRKFGEFTKGEIDAIAQSYLNDTDCCIEAVIELALGWGVSTREAVKRIVEGGIEMITTMNYSLQEKAQESLRDWDLEKLYNSTVFFLEDCKRNGWTNEEGNYELLIDVISEGWMGVHQVDEILDVFNLWDYVEDEEWKWEVIDDFTMKLGELITQVMQDKYGLQGVYYFSSLDTGEFGLIYSEEA